MLIEYKQIGLFDDILDDEDESDIVDEKDNFTLVQNDLGDGNFLYKVFDENGLILTNGTWKSKIDALSMKTTEYTKSTIKNLFLRKIWEEKKYRKAEKDRLEKERSKLKQQAYDAAMAKKDTKEIKNYGSNYSSYKSSWDNSGLWGSYYSYSGYNYQPKPKSTGFLDKLNKSDTLVVHCADRTTDMLSQIYDGKGWDVLTDGNIDKEELHQLIKNHARIIMLGHGTSSGLINKQGSGFVIGAPEAPLLKDKKLFVIWCNADGYFKQHNIGDGQFITGNMPSEVWECRAAGCGDISAELMLENITYWSKLCADVTERALNGDVKGAVEYVRDNYIKKYGNHPVTIYNAERTKVQGEPMDDLSDRYWGPKELLHPVKPSYSSFSYKPVSVNTTINNIRDTKDLHDEDDADLDDEDEEEANSDYTIEELQEFADDVSGLYQVNPDLEDFNGDVDAMCNYIEETESLIEQIHDLEDVEYWMDIEEGNKVGIKIALTNTEVYQYEIVHGRLFDW